MTEESLGPIDILVANAGGPPSTLFETTTDEQYLAAIRAQLVELDSSRARVRARHARSANGDA